MIRTGGYTLLEMVVVVAVLALATAMVAPAGSRMVTSWREAGDVDQVLQAMAALPVQARREGRTLAFPSADAQAAGTDAEPGEPALRPLPLPLPDGWSLQFQTPLSVQPNGVCSDASGVLHTARQSLPFRIEAPFCRVHRLAAGAG